MKKDSSRLHVCAATLAVLLSVFLFSGFTSQDPNAEKNDAAVKIGFLVHDLVSERWQKDMNFFVNRITELGGIPVTKNAFGDVQTQIAQLKELIDQGVKVIAIVPVDGKALVDMVDYANEKGVKIIAYDRLIKNCNIDYYISYNSVRTGELMAQYVVSRKPKGNYAFVNGPISDNNAVLIKQGQMNVLRPYIDKGDIKIVLNQSVAAWGPLEALMVMEEFLGTHKGDVDVVLASSDGLSDGVIQALSTSGKYTNTLVTGQDASVTACKNIMQGYQAMSVYKSIKKISYAAADLAMKIANKKPIETSGVTNNGKKDVPSIFFEPVVVDKANLKDIVIKDGHINEADLQ